MPDLLSHEFLARYEDQQGLETLLQKAVFLSKIAMPIDEGSWLRCIRRVVEGNCARDPDVTRGEAEALFDAMFHCKILPSGRGLRATGVPGMPNSAVYNCHGVELKKTSDLSWALDQLMCGGGVGFSLLAIDQMPEVRDETGWLPVACRIYCRPSHPDYKEVAPNGWLARPRDAYVVPDTRAGWKWIYGEVIEAAFADRPISIDLSGLRANGTKLETFGGTASGPAPLAKMLRETYRIIRGAAGRRLTSVEWLHVITHMGVCVSSGGGRRSALWVGSHRDDEGLYNAKHDDGALHENLYASNNSIVFTSPDQWREIDGEGWRRLAESMLHRGDPGILNLWRMREDGDPNVTACNPCAEIPTEDRESCCVGTAFPSRWTPEDDEEGLFRLITRFLVRQRLVPLDDPEAEAIRQKNMRIGVGLSGVVDVPGLDAQTLRRWYGYVRGEANGYCDELGVARPIKVTTMKPEGTVGLIADVAPGFHAPHAPFGIRRLDVEDESPLCGALKGAGVRWEPSAWRQRTTNFAFPIRRTSTVYESTETLGEQFARLRLLQDHWADNSVSCTIKAHPHEAAELARLLEEHVPHLKTVSCLAREATAFKQAPYEEITELQYETMRSYQIESHPLTYGGDSSVEECAGGACPL